MVVSRNSAPRGEMSTCDHPAIIQLKPPVRSFELGTDRIAQVGVGTRNSTLKSNEEAL